MTARRTSPLSVLFFFVTIGFTLALSSFKVMDGDFWWHLKAGEVMWKSGSLIHTDPFAYTRAGLPYLTHHEWLSQVALYLVHRAGGFGGIILLRAALVSLTFLLLLMIDPPNIWPNAVCAVFAANAARPGYVDRPQLFTYAILAGFLFLVMRLLEGGERRRLFPALVALELLWVNFHGAASLLGLAIAGAAACQERLEKKAMLKPWAVLLGLLAVAFFITPSGLENIGFTRQLFGDQTMQFIDEWTPRSWDLYLKAMGPFWVLGAWSLWRGRQGRVFCGLLFLATGILSRKAFRHEILFVIASTAVAFFQLKHDPAWQRGLEAFRRRKTLSWALALCSIPLLGTYSYRKYTAFCARYQLQGLGAFAPAQGAYEFLERENVQGRMFNTYGVGGYLIYRGYPGRLVFNDCRNVDYGFEFLKRAFAAAFLQDAWRSIEEVYSPTYAVIGYEEIAQPSRIPYCGLLGRNPAWKLVYLDDWTAVYLKDIPENRMIIDKDLYRIATPELLQHPELAGSIASDDVPRARQELERVASAKARAVLAVLAVARSPAQELAERILKGVRESFSAHLEKGMGLARQARYDEALKEFVEAQKLDPGSPAVLNDIGGIYHQKRRWPEALKYFEQAAARDPALPDAQVNLAKVLCSMDRCAEALPHAEKAQALGAEVTDLLAVIRSKMRKP